jgi:hypothetical protein
MNSNSSDKNRTSPLVEEWIQADLAHTTTTLFQTNLIPSMSQSEEKVIIDENEMTYKECHAPMCTTNSNTCLQNIYQERETSFMQSLGDVAEISRHFTENQCTESANDVQQFMSMKVSQESPSFSETLNYSQETKLKYACETSCLIFAILPETFVIENEANLLLTMVSYEDNFHCLRKMTNILTSVFIRQSTVTSAISTICDTKKISQLTLSEYFPMESLQTLTFVDLLKQKCDYLISSQPVSLQQCRGGVKEPLPNCTFM